MSRPLVLKFGGTALGSPARVRLAARRVKAHVARGRRVVVVVSATGHTTDLLLRRAHAVSGARAPLRELDRALATGEDLSAALLALSLGALGVAARSLRGGEAGVLAEGDFGAGVVRRVHTARLLRLLAAGVVPVVTGFQAVRADGETVTLGRGGSDTSAVAIAHALSAACHIVTDVDGVFDRDPRLDGHARPFATLTHDELVALAERGAQVVHAPAAHLARAGRVPLLVYSYRAPLSGRGGTRVSAARAEPREGAA